MRGRVIDLLQNGEDVSAGLVPAKSGTEPVVHHGMGEGSEGGENGREEEVDLVWLQERETGGMETTQGGEVRGWEVTVRE